jgi:hypothetical protein
MTFIGSTGWPSRRTNETKRPEKVDELELQLPTTGFYRILLTAVSLSKPPTDHMASSTKPVCVAIFFVVAAPVDPIALSPTRKKSWTGTDPVTERIPAN